ncbi:hypothetical protein D5086_027304 [Populus alba]|uniref:Uncharacterized protein n=1 Tax=Populus alba TaxID=43335 RepID=A0ACC4AUZ8_POPAL
MGIEGSGRKLAKNNGTRASLPEEIFDVQTCIYTLNDYKPGVGGGPDGQILNQCFLRVRFFLPLIVLLFDARSFYGSKNLSLSKTLPKSASGWGRVFKVPVPGSTVHRWSLHERFCPLLYGNLRALKF